MIPPHHHADDHRIPAGTASLYARTLGDGRPIVVLHGGPDFDHRYLLPDLDRLAESFRLVYYDQRGRGASATGVRAEEVSMASEIEDLDSVRRHFGFGRCALLGHSWGALPALEYALQEPGRVSHLILMNPAPVSAGGAEIVRRHYRTRLGADLPRQQEIIDSSGYRAGDPETVAARYRIHFATALTRVEDLERLMARMEAAFASQGPLGILLARAVEERLFGETWEDLGYDLLPRLENLRIPALVISGDHDFIPAEIADGIAKALPDARHVAIRDCGHFAFLERADDVRRAVRELLG